MLIYSHLIVASVMEPYVKPLQIEDYYLGAIAPDVRYYAGIPRSQTHIPLDEIAGFVTRYPNLTSFVLGYLVHCASENLPKEAGLTAAVFNQFPFSIKAIRGKLPSSFVSVVLTFYHIENFRIQSRVSENGNEMLRDLGIDDTVTREFARKFNRFLIEPTLSSGMIALQELGLLRNEGMKRYLRIAQIVNIYPIRHWLFSLIRKPINDFHQKSIPILLERCKPLIQNWNK